MLIQIQTILKNIDWLLLVAVFLLVCLGLTSLYSLGLSEPEKDFGLLNRQVLSSVFGFIMLFVFVFLDYRWLNSLSIIFYIVSVLLLLLVLFLGTNLQGTTGWFVFGNFSFQPIELVKLSVIILLARCFSNWSHEKYTLRLWLKTFLIILPVCILLLLQPDFGSMIIILFVWFGLLFLSGISKKNFLIFLLILILISSIGWQFILRDYQQNRILSFLNPQNDPLGIGYNTRQSIIAVGSGGLFGRGLGLGTQSQLHFLPVSEADFIFSSLAEELGFFGILFIFVLYFFIFYRLFKIIKKTTNDFALLLVSGFCLMFFSQVLINIGMTIGLLPVTGLPLPFVSYGGSFLLISLISIGIIQSVKLHGTN